MSQVDKYIYKYDVNKNEGYILGDLGKKSTKVWKEETAEKGPEADTQSQQENEEASVSDEDITDGIDSDMEI